MNRDKLDRMYSIYTSCWRELMPKDLREELGSLSADHRLELGVHEPKGGEFGNIFICVENPHKRPQWSNLCAVNYDRWEYHRLMPVIKMFVADVSRFETILITVGELRAILNGGEDGLG